MFRVPLWDVRAADSREIGSSRASRIPLLDLHELAAGKLTARCADPITCPPDAFGSLDSPAELLDTGTWGYEPSQRGTPLPRGTSQRPWDSRASAGHGQCLGRP